MEKLIKKPKRNTDFSIRSLINSSQNHISHTTSPSKSTSNESLQYSPSSSSAGSHTLPHLSWSNNQPHWLPDAEIIDKARKKESF